MTPVNILRGARTLIADSARWIDPAVMPNSDAVLSDGVTHVRARSAEAVQFSGYGAIVRVGRRVRGGEVAAARAALDHAVGGKSFREWCRVPGRTHAEVLGALDRAIAAAEIVAGLVRAEP